MILRNQNNKECVIDTTVLFFATTYNNRTIDHDAVLLLEIIKKYHIVALDFERRILTEYENCIKITRDHLIKSWFSYIVNTAGKAAFYCGNISQNHLNNLINIGFRQKDEPFLGVAVRAKDNLLIFGEDRHYNCNVCNYALQNWKVTIAKYNNCLL